MAFLLFGELAKGKLGSRTKKQGLTGMLDLTGLDQDRLPTDDILMEVCVRFLVPSLCTPSTGWQRGFTSNTNMHSEHAFLSKTSSLEIMLTRWQRVHATNSTHSHSQAWVPWQGLWKYLPGEQQRTLVMDKRFLSLGLAGDESTGVRTDQIPLHEVTSVTRGDEELSKMFKELDTNKDGLLSRAEFEEGLASIGFSAKLAHQFFDEMDTDGDEEISPEEFQDLSKGLKEHCKRLMRVSTVADGYNSGRSYFFEHLSTHHVSTAALASDAAAAKSQTDVWVAALLEGSREATKRNKLSMALRSFQTRLSKTYAHTVFQGAVALMIAANFALTAGQMQVQPPPSSSAERAFELGDMIFTIIFTLELLFNMAAHWYSAFWADGWNVFDFVVVIVTLISMGPFDLPGFKTLRLIRAFRVLRIFARLGSLRMLISALTASLMPVLNALTIVMIVVSIYAVLGVSFFVDKDPAHFSSFAQSMFTMFQVATFDDWGDIARFHFNEQGQMMLLPSLFFMSFLLIVSFTLLPVVVAVLLDNFTQATRKEKDKLLLETPSQHKTSVLGSIDPVIKSLLSAPDQEELTKMVDNLFLTLDADRGGSISYHELREGLKKMRLETPMLLTEQEYDVMTEHGTLCDDEGEIDQACFQVIMRNEMLRFANRHLAVSVPAVLKDDQHMGILMFAVKLVLNSTSGKDFAASHANNLGVDVHSISSAAAEGMQGGNATGEQHQRVHDNVDPADVGGDATASANHQNTISQPCGSEPNDVVTVHVDLFHPLAKLQQAESSPRTADSVKREVQDGLKETIRKMEVVQEQQQQQQVEAAASTAEIMQALASLNDALWTLVARVASVEEQNLRLHDAIFLNGHASEGKTSTLVTKHRIDGSRVPSPPPRRAAHSVLQSDRKIVREKVLSASISPKSVIPHTLGTKASVLQGQSAMDGKERPIRRQPQTRLGTNHLVRTLAGAGQIIRSYEANGSEGGGDQRENQRQHSMRVAGAESDERQRALEFGARSSHSQSPRAAAARPRREGVQRPAARLASPGEAAGVQASILMQEHAKGAGTHLHSSFPLRTRRNMSNDVVLTSPSAVLSTNDSRRLENSFDRPTSFSTTRTINSNTSSWRKRSG